MSVFLALPAVADAADDASTAPAADDAPACPVGVFKCPKKPPSWELCKKNDLLDFYVPGLPTDGDRSLVPKDASALKVSSPDKTHYVLEDHAEIKQLDLLLRADRITYDTETTDYSANGNVRYQDRGLLVSADHGEGNADLDQCTLDGVRYQLLSGRGNGVAQVAVIDDVGHAHLTDARYSTCDVDEQQWAFTARQMDLDQDEGVGRARNVTFRLFNVPFFWLPYARFALDDRRESGFLFPTIGYSNRR
ncbi:MAG TPA: LPS-assembly protein LptD, partial [Dokdonella sp.]